MFFKLNAYGYLNVRSMAEYSLDACEDNSSQFAQSVLHNVRKFGNDYVYDKYWINKIVNIMKPTEILIVKPIEDYFLVEICTQYTSQQYFLQWCEVNHLIPNNYINLKRFIKEVRCIWQEH